MFNWNAGLTCGCWGVKGKHTLKVFNDFFFLSKKFLLIHKSRYMLAGESSDVSSWKEELTLRYYEKTSVYLFLILFTPWTCQLSPWTHLMMKRNGRRLSDRYFVIHCHYLKWGEKSACKIFAFWKKHNTYPPTHKNSTNRLHWLEADFPGEIVPYPG